MPSISTIWRILSRRGFIDPEPNKRPHNSFIRFEAALPNECWQADVTLWVPRSSSTLCNQAIFMDESAHPICPLES